MGNKQATVSSVRVGLEDFEIVKLVGKGAFGKVWQVIKKDTGQVYAMKVLRKSDILEQNLVDHTKLERDIMGYLGDHSPFIVNMHFAFQTEDKLYFVLDYLNGGSLFSHLRDHGPFSEDLARFYAAEIILALQTLHHNDVVYRDLKLENILLDSEGHLRMTDFGLSARMKEGKIHSFSGTAAYIAPEILMDRGEGHDKSVDWWSLGIVVHLFLTHEPPFWSENHKTLFEKIISDPVNLDRFTQLSEDAKDLLHGLLNKDETKRLGCGTEGLQGVMDHQFFSSINWEDLKAKKVKPPFVPNIEDFETSVVETDPSLPSPKRTPQRYKRAFKGFSYVADRPPLQNYNAERDSSSPDISQRDRRKIVSGGKSVDDPGFQLGFERAKWVPDEDATACYACKAPFSTFRRRHHCRACGRIFDGFCSSKRMTLPKLGYRDLVRVCETCHKTLLERERAKRFAANT